MLYQIIHIKQNASYTLLIRNEAYCFGRPETSYIFIFILGKNRGL